MRTLIISDRAHKAGQIRATSIVKFAGAAAAINDSPALMTVYAAPEWQELSEDGQQWVMALIRETIAVSVEYLL